MNKSLFSLNRQQPQVMAVLNVTPDSFSDGGRYFSASEPDPQLCRRRIEQVIAEGAAIIDVGGESTRPGARPVSEDEEMHRVMPVLEILRDYDIRVSLDSSNPQLISEAAKTGIALINDVRALQREGALQAAAETGLPVCLMHMQGQPHTMQNQPEYPDVLLSVSDFFSQRIAACEQAGIDRSNLLLDPGFGFGKTVAHNSRLLAHLQQLQQFALPLLAGMSRKSMISDILTDRPIDQRLAGSLALAVIAVQNGAWIVRAHDIAETVDAVRVAAYIMRECNG